MRQKPHMLILVLGIGLSLATACKSAKTPQTQAATQTASIGKCDQTIKYYSEKIKSTTGQETSFNTEITVNPQSRLINIVSEPPNQEKVAFSIVIESIDCDFNNDYTVGQALYHGYINQKDGTTTKMILKLEANDGALTFSQANPEKEGEFIVIVSKWEIVKE
jgi:hypothetical protein